VTKKPGAWRKRHVVDVPVQQLVHAKDELRHDSSHRTVLSLGRRFGRQEKQRFRHCRGVAAVRLDSSIATETALAAILDGMVALTARKIDPTRTLSRALCIALTPLWLIIPESRRGRHTSPPRPP
jgi:hypothetical protein